jgi:hypothetical protein
MTNTNRQSGSKTRAHPNWRERAAVTPLEREGESLADEWHQINRELTLLAAARAQSDAGAWVEPSAEEAALLERLDEIELELGREYLERLRQDKEALAKPGDGPAAT